MAGDIGGPEVDLNDNLLTVKADLLVVPEFATFLQDRWLASSNLTGADVGNALVAAIVPEPTGLRFLAMTLAPWLLRRRRRG